MQAHLLSVATSNVAALGRLEGEVPAYLISADQLLYFIPCPPAQRLLQCV